MTQPYSPQGMAYPVAGDIVDGKYLVERMLGEGGMGAVVKAQHLLRKAPVALKFMNPSFVAFPGAVERFMNEGVAASQIDTDHVTRIFDVGQMDGGVPYLVMEYMDGADLADVLLRDGRPGLPIARAVHFVLQALRGLQVAHAAGIIHRDMKPSNCFVVVRDGEPDFVKLLDFGISKVKQPGQAALTQTNSALGTPLYMSPEQARSPRDVDTRSDIYSVGVILFELLTGRTPFFSESGEFTEILFKLFTADPPHIKSVRGDLPDALAEVVHHALGRTPDLRYSTVAEMAEALTPFAGEESAQVLSRIRNHGTVRGVSRGSGKLQLPPQSIVPATNAAAPSEAHMMTQASIKAIAVPGAKTDLGATRDNVPPAGAAARPKFPIALAAVPVVVMSLVAIFGYRMMHSQSGRITAVPQPSAEVLPVTTAVPSASVVDVMAVPVPIPTPMPSASATAMASATPTASAKKLDVVPRPQPRPQPSRNALNPEFQ